MTEAADEHVLTPLCRRNTQAATRAIAAQIGVKLPHVIFELRPTDYMDPDIFLEVRVPGDDIWSAFKREPIVTFAHGAGITVRALGHADTLDWLDVFDAPFAETARVLIEAINREQPTASAGPGNLQLIHDAIATMLALALGDDAEWRAEYTPRELQLTFAPGCTLYRGDVLVAWFAFPEPGASDDGGAVRFGDPFGTSGNVSPWRDIKDELTKHGGDIPALAAAWYESVTSPPANRPRRPRPGSR